MLKYFSFLGRATRQEYWAVNIIAVITAGIIGALINVLAALSETTSNVLITVIFMVLGIFLWLSLLSVIARRLRDAGISLWWMLLLLVPGVGFIVWIVWGCIRSKD